MTSEHDDGVFSFVHFITRRGFYEFIYLFTRKYKKLHITATDTCLHYV